MRYICTYFDSNFLPRGLALYDSIKQNSASFKLFVLALDDECYNFLIDLNEKNIEVISLVDYTNFFGSNHKNKFKNEKEFYFSITPALCLYVIKKYSNIDILLYLDADVYLFNDIELIYSEIGKSSIAMCTHRLPWYIRLVSKNYGIYNVGVNAFRNDQEGNNCLNNWYKDCTEWIPNQNNYSLSFFSDQIWLDKWPELYTNIKIINNIGINVAPWNAQQYTFSIKNSKYFVNDLPLVLYHFSSLKKLNTIEWHGNTSYTILNISGKLLDIYKVYIQNILKYEYKTTTSMELKFNGSKIKMLAYNFFKIIHNHIIKVEKEK